MRRWLVGWSVLCLAMILFASSSTAQQDTGTIAGTVTDPSGSVVPGAEVTVRNLGTGYSRATSTGPSGEYVFTPLLIGDYEVRVGKPGFKTQIHGRTTLDVQQRIQLDFKLQLGEASQKVEVVGTALALQTQDSSLGTVVNSSNVSNLPLNGRNIYQLVTLSPGASVAPDGMPSMGGQLDQNQGYVLDGLTNINYLGSLNSGGVWNIRPSPDAVQEFKVNTNSYSAEFGGAEGIVNVVTKSGTNDLHGSLYEFVRNADLDGRNFFATSMPRFSQNQFGGSMGGPLAIPHLYDGHNRSFFFIDYEGFRSRVGTTQFNILPSMAWRQGDFRDQLTGQTFTDPCTGAVYDTGQIFDPNSTQAVTCLDGSTGFARTPVSYNGQANVMNPAQIVLPAANTAALLPAPNVGDPFKYIWSPSLRNDFNQFDVNIDHQWGEHDHLAFKYSFRDVPPAGIPDFPGAAGSGSKALNRQQRATAADTHVFSPTTINEFRLGYIRNAYTAAMVGDKYLDPASLGFQNVPFQPGVVGGPPGISITGIAAIGTSGWTPVITTARTETLMDTLSLVRGRHTFKIGGGAVSWWTSQYEAAAIAAQYSFSGILTADLSAPSSMTSAAATGAPFAQFLFGIPDSSAVSNSIFSDSGRQSGAVFIQDDWRATDKLTLNMGLRWDFGNSVRERFDRVTNIDMKTGAYIEPKSRQNIPPFLPSGYPVEWSDSHSLLHADNRSIAPRLGLAYQITPKTVLRAAAGIFFINLDQAAETISMPLNPPFAEGFNAYSPNTGPIDPITGKAVVAVTSITTGFPADWATNPDLVSMSALEPFDPNIQDPYTVNWNFTVQRDLGFKTLLDVAYSATAGRHLWVDIDDNQPYPTANPNIPVQSRRPFPNLGPFGYYHTMGKSSYNALQTKIERRMSNGLTFMGGYTWSHSLDDVPLAILLGNSGEGGSDSVRNARNWGLDYGNSSFNVTHRFVMSWLYDLPVGRGKPLGRNLHGLLNGVVGGWQIGGITSLQTGFWFVPFTYIDPANAPVYASAGARPNLLGKPKDFSYGQDVQASYGCPTGHQSLTCFFNPAAFGYASPGTFGNAGRNIVEGPGFVGVDFTAHKEFPIGEKKRLEFRAEVFNILNTPNFGNPDIGYEDSTFGELLYAGAPRQIQFALRLVF